MTIVERLVSIVAPHKCVVCGNEGHLLCSWCKLEAISKVPETCYRCHKLSPDSAVCASCRRASSLKYVWVRANYSGSAKTLVQMLKFQRAKAAASVIADLMREVLPYLPDKTIVTHVPAATRRARSRGYDQAKLLAKEVARLSRKNHSTLLARQGQTRQVGSNRPQRLKQLSGAFRPLKPYIIKGADILLVDDVLTTGATLEESSKTLKRAGAKSISAVVFAHKQ